MNLEDIHILIIDDDEINNFIAAKLIKKVESKSIVNTCLNGLEGIDYLKGLLDNQEQMPDVIFLDINMPVKNGWEFLDEYENFKSSIQKEINIYMLSSSVYNDDIKKSETYSDVKRFISKPLTLEKLENLITNAVVKVSNRL
jgi:CheY-like chemotaxis protein